MDAFDRVVTRLDVKTYCRSMGIKDDVLVLEREPYSEITILARLSFSNLLCIYKLRKVKEYMPIDIIVRLGFYLRR